MSLQSLRAQPTAISTRRRIADRVETLFFDALDELNDWGCGMECICDVCGEYRCCGSCPCDERAVEEAIAWEQHYAMCAAENDQSGG